MPSLYRDMDLPNKLLPPTEPSLRGIIIIIIINIFSLVVRKMSIFFLWRKWWNRATGHPPPNQYLSTNKYKYKEMANDYTKVA